MRSLQSQLAVALASVGVFSFASVSLAAPPNVVELTGSQIKTDLLAGTYTATELVQAYIARTQIYNGNYNAFTLFDPTGALAQAAALDAQLASNPSSLSGKPLLGSVVVIKDSMNVAGQRTTAGWTGFVQETGGVNMIALNDAPIVSRLRAGGAIVLGKTNLPRFARSGASANTSYLGPTFNAYNRSRVPGGSSSGSATATSASFATMGTAEETGGSIQNPAGAQGLVGVKTTFGLVPTTGGVPLTGSTRDVFGPNAKSVRDAALMLDAISGPDPSDPNTAGAVLPVGGFTSQLSTTALQGKKFGLITPSFKNVGNPAAPIALSSDVTNLYNQAITVLQSQGATVTTTDIWNTSYNGRPWKDIGATFTQWGGTNLPWEINEWMKTMDPARSPTSVAAYNAAAGNTTLLSENGPLLGSFAATAPNTGAGPALAAVAANPTVPNTAAIASFMAGRAEFLAALDQVMTANNLDGFFFPQQFAQPGILPAGTAAGSYSAPTVSEINLLGTPQVNLPFGYYSDGTPFSIAFWGKNWTEAQLLGYAFDFESAIAGTSFARVAPTLLIPEPAMMVSVLGSGLVILRRRRA
jgi:amidase